MDGQMKSQRTLDPSLCLAAAAAAFAGGRISVCDGVDGFSWCKLDPLRDTQLVYLLYTDVQNYVIHCIARCQLSCLQRELEDECPSDKT